VPKNPRAKDEASIQALAYRYLRRGWSIIPIGPDKKPLTAWAPYQKRLATTKELGEWWDRYPEANVGIVTGLVSGIIVLDADGPEGLASLEGLQLPATPVATTGRGTHYYYRHPGIDSGERVRNFARRLPGLDLRGDGGYVIAPPSLHPSGATYTWTSDPDHFPLADTPHWLRAIVSDGRTPKGKEPEDRDPDAPEWYLSIMAKGVASGGRNDAVARLAGYFLAKGLDADVTFHAVQAVNATKFQPPLDVDEVERTVFSIAKAEKRRLATVSILSDETLEPDDRRDLALQAASHELGFSVERVTKYLSDPPTFELLANGARIRLGGVEALIERVPFRRRIAASLGRLVNIKPKEWADVAGMLLGAALEVEVRDATEEGSLDTWLTRYVEDNAPAEGDDWPRAAWEGAPFEREDGLYVSLAGLRKYVTATLDEKVTTHELALMLRRARLEPVTIKVTLDGRATTRGVWRVPRRRRAPAPGGDA